MYSGLACAAERPDDHAVADAVTMLQEIARGGLHDVLPARRLFAFGDEAAVDAIRALAAGNDA